jgi:hypothetical protein
MRHEKLRRDISSSPAAHKISVTIDGWQEVVPAVTVDRVGVFMHDMHPMNNTGSIARLVTQVSMKDGQKFIELRSAILLRNETTVAIEFRLERPDMAPAMLAPLAPGGTVSIPVHLISAVLKLRPSNWGVHWSTTGISWQSLATMKEGERKGLALSCRSIGSNLEPSFHCCTSVTCEPVPVSIQSGPSHTLTVYPPILLTNLLPVDSQYLIVDTQFRGELRSGAGVALYDLDPHSFVRLQIKIAGFAVSSVALINAESSAVAVDRTLRLLDSKSRTLLLDLRNSRLRGSAGSRIVSYFAPYWMVNHTALALVYRQPLRSQTAAGQSSDPAEACRPSLTMFSCDGETLSNGNKCSVRINQVRCSIIYSKSACPGTGYYR